MGYNAKFLSGATIPMVQIDRNVHHNLVTPRGGSKNFILHEEHYSVVLNKDRRLAIVSACNIDGSAIPKEKIPRKGSFRNHPNIDAKFQLGTTFYDLCGSVLDKGHLTKYEDVIWGKGITVEKAQAIAAGTNYYSNAVPQHQKLNRGKWSSLELYILDTETEKNEMKVCVFTGPILNENDPLFKKFVDEESIQLPLHFWKIVVYKKNKKLFALGFMMSHQSLLKKSKLVRMQTQRGPVQGEDEVYFMDFKHKDLYQVRVEQIEKLAGIKLTASTQIEKPYRDARPLGLIFRDIDVRKNGSSTLDGMLTASRLMNLVTE